MTAAGFPEAKIFPHESHGVRIGAQLVRVGDPAGQDDAVIVADPEPVGREVDVKSVGLVEVIESL